MSIRIAILTLLVIGLAVYAWKDWFKGVCGLVLLMAVLEHPDMPKNIMGIQGLNPWNLLMLDILLAWFVGRRRERLVWDMPRHILVLLLLYLGVIVVGFARMIADPAHMEPYTVEGLASEYLINCVKWMIPGLLLFDGCRTKARLQLAVGCILGLYLLLAIQVIKYVPASVTASGESMNRVALRLCSSNIGYHRVNLSALLSGASWAMLATMPLMVRRWQQGLVLVAFIMVAYAQALTGGRMGYVTWGVVGLTMCLLRWRWVLLAAPLVPIIIAVAMPGAAERMLQGFGQTDAAGGGVANSAEITSDRILIWPYVIEKIAESPAIGYGRVAMIRTGLRDEYPELDFPHPHNAYLECLLDNGLVGFIPIGTFYTVVMSCAIRLFLDRHNPLCSVVGGIACALVLALLVASMGSQTFYPREGAVGMWAAIGLMFRLSLARSKLATSGPRAAVARCVSGTRSRRIAAVVCS